MHRICLALGLVAATLGPPQEPRAPQSVSPAQLKAAIDKLGNLDYAIRSAASRTVRRDPGTSDSMREALASPNDRLRTVAYGFFERNPDPVMVPGLLAALDKETSEF